MYLPKHFPHRTVDGAMSEEKLETEIEGAMALKNLNAAEANIQVLLSAPQFTKKLRV